MAAPAAKQNDGSVSAVKHHIAYSMYRDMLGSFHDKANVIVDALPRSIVREDQGVTRQIESMVRQSSQLSGGGASPVTPGEMGGNSAPPPPPPMPAPVKAGPPPPPPPPMPTGIPAVRLGSEIESRGSRLGPPLAIQAAMGKDKKPFTYTPGGIDLSEIRSPRMQRRICRNAAAEGVSTTPAPSNAANANSLGVTPNSQPVMPPQIAVPVLPPPPPPQPPQHSPMKATPVAVKASPPSPAPSNSNNKPPQTSQQQATISVRPPPPPNFPPPNSIKNNVVNNNNSAEPIVVVKKTSPTSVYIPSQQQAVSQPGHIYVAPVVPKESGGQLGSLYIPPVTQAPNQQVKSQTPPPQSPGSPIHSALSKAPMPWMNSQARQAPAQSPPVGLWSPPTPPSNGNAVQPSLQQAVPSNTRIIPIHMPATVSVAPTIMDNRTKQKTAPKISFTVEGRDVPVCPSPPASQQQSSGSRTRIVPIQIEGAPQQQQQQQRRPGPIYAHNKFAQDQNNTSQSPTPQTPMTPVTPSQGRSSVPSTPMSPTPGPPGAPVQSRSFRVLQKITASEEDDGQGGVPQAAAVSQTGPPPPPPAMQQQQQQQQQRKLLLTNEDRQLMDRFRAQDLGPPYGYPSHLGPHVQSGHPQDEDEQATRLLYRGANIPSRVFRLLDQSVDEDTFLHTEADPRYRGAAIPSRAFRMLQTMTDTGPPASVPGGSPQMYQGGRPDVSSPQGGVSRHDSASPQQVYVPASEQGAQPEPRKYTGSCIPSRSFRMLQAMTAPEDCETTSDNDIAPEAMYYTSPSPCPSPYSWYYPPEGGSGDPVWDSYVYAYYANYGQYPPPPGFYYPGYCNYESDDYSGYSSTEEMAYYGGHMPPANKQIAKNNMIVNGAANTAGGIVTAIQPVQTQGAVESTSDEEYEENDDDEEDDDNEDDSDTEVEESEDERKKSRSNNSLQAIKSVPDIHASSKCEEYDVEEADENEASDCESEDNESRSPHLCGKQLSIIYEESEHSDAESVRRMRLRAASTPALTETEEEEEESSDPDEDLPPCTTNSTTVKCDNYNELRDKKLSDDEIEAKPIIKDVLDRCKSEKSPLPVDSDEIDEEDSEQESEEESDEESDTNQTPSQVPKINEKIVNNCSNVADSEESSDEEVVEQPLNVVKAISEYESDGGSSTTRQKEKQTTDEDSSDDNECNNGKLQTSSTVVEINKGISQNDNDDSSSEEEEEEEEEQEATVTVRLPLRLKFSRNSCEEAVTTVIVGDSEEVSPCKLEAKPPTSAAKVEEWMQRGEQDSTLQQSSTPEVSVCLSLPLRRNPIPPPEAEDSHWEDDSSSTSIQTVRPRCASIASVASTTSVGGIQSPPSQENSSEPVSPATNDPPPIAQDQPNEQPKDEFTVEDTPAKKSKNKEKTKSNQLSEKRTKRNIRRSSTEDDSGVTDLSRQMSDSESEIGAELLACQRAATHSRLFKLLQDACGDEDEDNENEGSEEAVAPRRELLRLPLRPELRATAEQDSSSLSSSGITSPASPTVAARLVRELAKELSRRKGKRQRPARLHAAAMRIMKEEDNDPYDTTTGSSASSDSGGARPSPLQGSSMPPVSAVNTVPQAYYPAYPPPPPPHLLAAYGPNYYEYLDYYNSWGAMDPRDYGVVPARAFRVLSNPGANPLDATYAKCPRITNRPNTQSPANRQPPQDPPSSSTPAS